MALTAHGLDELRTALTEAIPAQIQHLNNLLPVTRAYLDFARTRPDLYKLFMSPRADERAKGELWTAVVALWAYLHGVAGLDAMNAFHDGKPHSGGEAGLWALLERLARQGGEEGDVFRASAG